MVLMDGSPLIENEKKEDILILHITGRLDAIASPKAEKKVLDFVNSGEKYLVLDLKGVDYLSSAGMRMLLATMKKLKGLSGKCVVCSITPNVMDVLKMSGFDHVLNIADDVHDALNKF